MYLGALVQKHGKLIQSKVAKRVVPRDFLMEILCFL